MSRGGDLHLLLFSVVAVLDDGDDACVAVHGGHVHGQASLGRGELVERGH